MLRKFHKQIHFVTLLANLLMLVVTGCGRSATGIGVESDQQDMRLSSQHSSQANFKIIGSRHAIRQTVAKSAHDFSTSISLKQI